MPCTFRLAAPHSLARLRTFVTCGDGGVGDGGVGGNAKLGQSLEHLQALAEATLLAQLAHHFGQACAQLIVSMYQTYMPPMPYVLMKALAFTADTPKELLSGAASKNHTKFYVS